MNLQFLRQALFVALLFDDYAYRRTLEAEGVSETVFDIALVGEVKQLGTVAEYDKCRRFDACLCHIVKLQDPALVGRRLYALYGVVQEVVDHAGGDACCRGIGNEIYKLIEAFHALSGFC